MRSKESIARLARLLAACAWLLGAILLAKAIWERSSIFPLGQFNEPLLGYMLVFCWAWPVRCSSLQAAC